MKHRHYIVNNRTIAVKLLWAELEFDIKYAIAKRAKLAGVKGEQAKNFVFEESDYDWLLRTINTALGKVQNKLSGSLVDHSTMASDELLEQPTEYNLVFKFDGEWVGNPDTLMNLIHSYVVDFCVGEYMDMLDATAAAKIQLKADETLNEAYKETNAVIIETPKFIL